MFRRMITLISCAQADCRSRHFQGLDDGFFPWRVDIVKHKNKPVSSFAFSCQGRNKHASLYAAQSKEKLRKHKEKLVFVGSTKQHAKLSEERRKEEKLCTSTTVVLATRSINSQIGTGFSYNE